MCLTKIDNDIMYRKGIAFESEEEYGYTTVQGKSDTKECASNRSLKVPEHAMKVVERLFEERIRKTVEIIKIQIGFVLEKGTVDAMFAVRQQIEKCGKIRKKSHFVIVDLEKAFNGVHKEVI